MELKINEITLPEQITFNYEELKQELTEKVSLYETLVYTDEQIKEAKADRANLNKLKKALNDERIRLEKEYMIPFNNFKSEINEIIGIIDKPVAVIDKQVKEYEEKQKQDKLAKIQEYWDECEKDDWLSFEQIFDSKWLNASVSLKTATDAIWERLNGINNDLDTLKNLPEFGFEATEVYKTTLDLNKALNEGRRLSEIQKRKAEHEAEQARLAAEAEAKKQVEEFENDMRLQNEAILKGCEMAVQPPARQWVSFKAFLTVEDATALKRFFEAQGIQFEAI